MENDAMAVQVCGPAHKCGGRWGVMGALRLPLFKREIHNENAVRLPNEKHTTRTR